MASPRQNSTDATDWQFAVLLRTVTTPEGVRRRARVIDHALKSRAHISNGGTSQTLEFNLLGVPVLCAAFSLERAKIFHVETFGRNAETRKVK